MQKLEQLSVFGGIVIISSLVVVPLMGVEKHLQHSKCPNLLIEVPL